jgi:adenylate cyclase
VKRPPPLRRLIDGEPDDSGREIIARAAKLAVPTMVVSNAIGALVVVVLAVFVLPTPHVGDRGTVILINLVAAAIYLVAAIVVGALWGLSRLRKTHRWLLEDRTPSDDEQKKALRIPLRQMRVVGGLWLLAAILFAALNAHWSAVLAVVVGITVLLGGVTTSAISYLLVERIQRPAAARALSHGAPERPLLPGVKTRAMLAWALGGGVPLLGIMLVAIVDIGGRNLAENEMAVVALGLSAVSLAVGAGVTWQAARSTADPVLSVRDALHEVEGGNLETEVPVFDGSEMGLLQAGFNRMAHGLREREEIRDLFGRQVGDDVAREAIERGIELGGEEVEVAMLFVDLIGSTELAAERPPSEVVERLNEFFTVVIEVVEDSGGTINKFEGDAALAVFGAPVPRDDFAACALAAARELARRLPEEVEELEAGIGVSAGTVVAGNVGSEQRYEYTVIGDPVNEAARLCELAKDVDCRVLASATAVERAGGDEAKHWRDGETVELRGRKEETRTAVPEDC